ncbi:MAG: glycoside hydrolase family 43 protein [Bacillota bacterium]|jgi:arabinan endo-1,5-alpha-L-arabinosidase|nr:glycoside hydrolase family 43 protein [Bacillota bacterium]
MLRSIFAKASAVLLLVFVSFMVLGLVGCISVFSQGGAEPGTGGPVAQDPIHRPLFTKNASVHDPSVIRVGDTYYVFGSHLAAAKSDNLMTWTQISTNTRRNTLISNVFEEMEEALEWAQTNTFWAPDVIQLEDGRFYFYYCTCEGSKPLSALGVAVSDSIEGPYENLGVFLKSGMSGISPDGTPYNANRHPNAIDPHVFFDEDGLLWMVYGSYSGGIFILRMDPETGFPLPGQGYGKKLMGGRHSRIEGPYILYSPDSDYYYLFVSFGGLGSNDGYNIRVARSQNPDGPYHDAKGTNMEIVVGTGSLSNDSTIAPHGVKLMGNYQFVHVDGEIRNKSRGYKSPGHNSAYYDPDTGKYFVFFHTRFVGSGEHHEVRVHQMFINENGWPVIAPHRYAGETIREYAKEEVVGSYKLINHGKDVSGAVKESVVVKLEENGQVTGARIGSWSLDGRNLVLTIDGTAYKGVFIRQWDDDNTVWLMAFTALSDDGTAVWGSKVAWPDNI